MSEPVDLIAELEQQVAHSSIARRADVLRKVTDLFVAGSGHFSKEQIALFDEIMGQIISQVTVAARSRLAADLSGMANAPRQVLRTLALDDAIEVAGEVLEKSAALDDTILLETGANKGQRHLLAISRREAISSAVTDLLLDRGDHAVVLSAASNPGAEFSESGYSNLVSRSQNDFELAMRVWLRPEIPRRHLLLLLTEASSTVLKKLEDVDRNNVKVLHGMALRATDLLQSETRQRSESFKLAQERVEKIHASSGISEELIGEFAENDLFDETVVALSLLARLPVGAVERSVMNPQTEHLLVIAKATGLSWELTELLFGLRGTVSAQQLKQLRSSYMKLQPKVAKMAIDFYRMRVTAASAANA
jgi:uncharacterized protein (DUF2336 family)